MEIRFPTMFSFIKNGMPLHLKSRFHDLFSDVPEGLKQFLLFCLLFLGAGLVILVALAWLTLY